ncbi:group I truncated hemoglobin [Ectothiorhodospira shaposhnikovii]|uniref:group I truncated hemoglobin n=1 Tax=Ectothiorhodospira shaposhnikovii TaxID=1054 RepID=UPI001EE8DB9B|nr:group 1 truncated hemoglobin [Ectothiorhodospira shaposhnikovii]MCG5514123.1 group 1 truncated hemoglobin [Ectothiorhodospira shaposhnikovii]
MNSSSLYERLGGEDKIHALATTIFDLHRQNPAVRNRYVDSDRDKVIRLAAEFICAGTGGPQSYTGLDMVSAHRGMNISEEEYVAVVDDIVQAMQQHDIGEREQQEMLMILWSLKPEILRL